jgi:hypothetical protein
LGDFNALNEPEQVEAVWPGIFLADSEKNVLIVRLYNFDKELQVAFGT